MEVIFYDDWNWGDYLGGQGYASTLPGTDDTPKNQIGFIHDKKESLLIDVSTN